MRSISLCWITLSRRTCASSAAGSSVFTWTDDCDEDGRYNVLARGLGSSSWPAVQDIYVNWQQMWPLLEDGTEDYPFNTVEEAVEQAVDGTVIHIAPGDYDEPDGLTFSVRGSVTAPDGEVTIR